MRKTKFIAYAIFLFLLNYSCTKNEYPISFNEIERSFINTHADTIINEYYLNGKIKRSSRFLNRKPFGTTNTFYSNGNLKNCFFFNHKVELIYKADYFEDGSFAHSEGKPIYFYFKAKRDSIKIGKKFELAVIAAEIPNRSTNIILGKEEEEKIEMLSSYKMNNRGALFQHTLLKEGKQNIPVIIEIEHSTNVIERDTSWIEVFVYD